MVFVPVMLALYFALALLEDSGYMARAAFVMDRFMHALEFARQELFVHDRGFRLHGAGLLCHPHARK